MRGSGVLQGVSKAPAAAWTAASAWMRDVPAQAWSLAAACFYVAAIVPNWLASEGAIDGYVYTAYAWDFLDLTNWFGPHYFSYRFTHYAWITLFFATFGVQIGALLWKFTQLLTIAASVWAIARPHLDRWTAASAAIVVISAPWTVSTLATLYVDGSALMYTFLLLATLTHWLRSGGASLTLAALSGCILAVTVNCQPSMLAIGGLVFVGYFVATVRAPALVRIILSGVVAIASFAFTTAALFVLWSAFLHVFGGTPWSVIADWVRRSFAMQEWNVDIFGFVVWRNVAGEQTPLTVEILMTSLRNSQLELLAPAIILAGGLRLVIWSTLKLFGAPVADAPGTLTREYAAVSLIGALVLAFAITIGAIYVTLPYYLAQLLPFVYLTAIYVYMHLRGERIGEEEQRFSFMSLAALVSLVLLAVRVAVADAGDSAHQEPALLYFGMVLLIGACIVVLVPIAPRRILTASSVSGLIALAPLFYVAPNYYSKPFSNAQEALATDIVGAQLQLMRFIDANYPRQGFGPMPRSQNIFWHARSAFQDSLSSVYLADNYTLQIGHGSAGLPELDDEAKRRLASNQLRDLFLIADTPEQMQEALQTLDSFGVSYQLGSADEYAGLSHSVYFQHIRLGAVTPPASYTPP
ncbi:MAG: hypothetical protein AB7H66_01145 [Hyphomonadaceae bacterium]